MKQLKLTFMLTMLMSMVGAKTYAHDIEEKNADGVTIYYEWRNNKTELAVSYFYSYVKPDLNGYFKYSGNVVIPESVTYDGNTYSVTSIGFGSFYCCRRLTSVTIPNRVTSISSSAFSGCI